MSGDPNDLLTTPEVAEMLRCEYRKALRLVGDKIPSARVDGVWLTRRRDVDAYLLANTHTDRSSKKRSRGRGRRAA